MERTVKAISLEPARAASNGDSPFSLYLETFSRTTMASAGYQSIPRVIACT